MHHYSKVVSELFDLQKFAIKLGLGNIAKLNKYFADPFLKYPVIHIAGTNGKGSTAFYTAQILQACGLKVGLFTSPHLVDFRERIRINNSLISEQSVIDFWNDTKNLVHKLKATFFDTTTMMAMKYFADEQVDVAIFETGLGGRLDSTNIVKPFSIGLTPIAFDHQKHLGNTILAIAAEKAAIIKEHASVFSSQQSNEALAVIKKHLNYTNDFFYMPDLFDEIIIDQGLDKTSFLIKDTINQKEFSFQIPTPADYQVKNISLALALSRNFCMKNFIRLDMSDVQKILIKASWPGRMQIIQKRPLIIMDVSHNYSGIETTLNSLSQFIKKESTDLLLGLVNDKDIKLILNLLANKFRKIIVTEPDTHRKQDGHTLMRLLKEEMQSVDFIKDLKAAFEVSKSELKDDETLIILGSHYLVGSLLQVDN